MIEDEKPVAATYGPFAQRTAAAAFFVALAAVGAAAWLDRQATAAGPALAGARPAPNVAERLAQLPKPREPARDARLTNWFWRADTTPTASISSKPQFKNFVTDPSAGMPQ